MPSMERNVLVTGYRLYTRKRLWPMYLEANSMPFKVGSLKAKSFSARYLSTKKPTLMQSTMREATPFLLQKDVMDGFTFNLAIIESSFPTDTCSRRAPISSRCQPGLAEQSRSNSTPVSSRLLKTKQCYNTLLRVSFKF